MNVQFMHRIPQQKMQVAFKGETGETDKSLEELKKQKEKLDEEINQRDVPNRVTKVESSLTNLESKVAKMNSCLGPLRDLVLGLESKLRSSILNYNYHRHYQGSYETDNPRASDKTYY